MKLRKMWMDPSPNGEPLNSYLEFFKIYDDNKGCPTSDAYESVYVFTEEELKKFVTRLIEINVGDCGVCNHHLDGEPTWNIKNWLEGTSDIEALEIDLDGEK